MFVRMLPGLDTKLTSEVTLYAIFYFDWAAIFKKLFTSTSTPHHANVNVIVARAEPKLPVDLDRKLMLILYLAVLFIIVLAVCLLIAYVNNRIVERYQSEVAYEEIPSTPSPTVSPLGSEADDDEFGPLDAHDMDMPLPPA